MSNFPIFAKQVATTFQKMIMSPQVFVADVDGDALYEHYLKSFPPGTDPIFKKFSEHTCSCCKQFIRRAGNVISIDDKGKIHTVWDNSDKAPHPYNVVGPALRERVLAGKIADLFRVSKKETSFGAASTKSLDPLSKKVLTWEHFYTGPIPKSLQVDSPGQVRGDYQTTVQVFSRGLTELTPDAVETVLSLIEANNLYRGEEHQGTIKEFQKAQKTFLALDPSARDRFVWKNAYSHASRFRNTVIGTLVQDLSSGMDVEDAVKAFEIKVAPQNYKRTTSIITPIMVKKAMETIESLGLEPALERRFATIRDLSVNDVLWVDGGVRPIMKGGIGGILIQHAESAITKNIEADEEKAVPVELDTFVKTVLPEATSVEVLLKGEHLGNLMSLTAPVHPEPKQLFRWNNDFAWSYGGNVTDSIRERVKKAGGKVEGALLRVSLSWFNYDDLDLHIYEPSSLPGLRNVLNHIFYGNKHGSTGGVLDVDMNAGGGRTREAVENIVWTKKIPDGAYKVTVHNFWKRETSDPGFVVEIESGGKLTHFSHHKGVRDKHEVHVATLHMKNNAIQNVEMGDPAITASNISQTKWGLTTEKYVKVNAVTLSPNYWGENAVGNKHTFFVIDGAKNDEPTRGIYNEFLHPRLEPHRKVFEVIGDKTRCQPADDQLSGLGFSSTKRDSILVKVRQGKKQKIFNVRIGT